LLGKLDKKIAAGASLAGFVTSYLAQKWDWFEIDNLLI
jgi:hypothetical protein